MRAVVAGGMVSALAAIGLSDAFDVVFGSSAGAICGAYFLAGQTELGIRIFSEDINNARFVRRSRLLTGAPIIDLDFLVNDVMVRVKPLNVDAVLRSPTPLHVVGTDVASGEARSLDGFASGDELRSALRAGATMPIVAGGPQPFRGRHYFDASLSEPIPLRSAIAAGASHVVALLTRPRGVPRRVSWFDRWIIGPRLRRIQPTLADRYLSRTSPYQAIQDEIESGWSANHRAEILGIRPSITLSKLEMRSARLLDGAQSGSEAVHVALA